MHDITNGIKNALLDRAIVGATFEALHTYIVTLIEITEGNLLEYLDDLVDGEHLERYTVLGADTEEPTTVYTRKRSSMLDARMRALGLATKDGTTTTTLEDDLVTSLDIGTLFTAKLIALGKGTGSPPKSGPFPVHLAVGAEEKIWQLGARTLCALTIPAAKAEPADLLQKEILLALYASDDWTTTEAIQEAVNTVRATEEGVEHVAVQVIEQTLTDMFNAQLVDVEATEPKRWRESSVRVISRRAALLRHLLPGDGEAAVADLLGVLSVPNVALDQDIGALTDAGFLELGEDAVSLVREGGIPSVLVFVATEIVRRQRNIATPESVQASIQEIAQWREKLAAERRRGDDLATWLRKHGLDEVDVLNQERGIIRPAVAKGEPFEFTESRKVDAAEKGEILGEILELESQVQQVKLELSGTTETAKGKIKSLEADIHDLKSAAACNQRVVSIPAYRRTDWEQGKVFIHAQSDDRVLEEDDLPMGAQRTIPGTEKVAGEPGPASAEAVEKFAEAMKAKGYTIATPNGVEHIPPARAPITSMEKLDQILSIVLAAHFVARGLGMSEVQLAEDMPKGYAIEIPHEGGGTWPLAKSLRASLGRLKRSGVAADQDGLWAPCNRVKAVDAKGGTLVTPEPGEPGPLASQEQREVHRKRAPRKSRSEEAQRT